MRGSDDRSGSLFSYVDLEKRIRPDHPLRTIRRLVDDALASLDRTFADLCAALRAPLDPAGAAAAGDALAGVLLDPLRTPADGAAGLRSPVPLVRRARHRRSGLGPVHLFQEPRPAARRRHRSPVSDRSSGAPTREAAPFA